MGWFKGSDAKKKMSSINTLVSVMLVDGRLDDSELRFLKMACSRMGITQRELNKVLKNPGAVEFVPPKNNHERTMLLVDMVFMMLADGKIDQQEMTFCMNAAGRLGFSPSIIPQLTRRIVTKSQQGNGQERVVADVESFLQS